MTGNLTKKGIKQSFSWEPNSIINNPNISMKAKGLWLYMNSKPEGWDFAADRIALECSDGRDSIRAGLRELIENGLLSAKKKADGKILYILCSKTEKKPVEKSEVFHNPETGNPSQGADPKTEKPKVGKSHGGKIRPVNNKELEVRNNIKKEGVAGSAGSWPAGGRRPSRSDFETDEEYEKAFYAFNSITI